MSVDEYQTKQIVLTCQSFFFREGIYPQIYIGKTLRVTINKKSWTNLSTCVEYDKTDSNAQQHTAVKTSWNKFWLYLSQHQRVIQRKTLTPKSHMLNGLLRLVRTENCFQYINCNLFKNRGPPLFIFCVLSGVYEVVIKFYSWHCPEIAHIATKIPVLIFFSTMSIDATLNVTWCFSSIFQLFF